MSFAETDAAVGSKTALRTLLAHAVENQLPIHHVDIKNAFLYGKLGTGEVIQMRIPPGYERHSLLGKVCHLEKSLYGLKHAPRACKELLSKELRSAGLEEIEDGLWAHKSSPLQLFVYVDDLIVVREPGELLEHLQKRFVVTVTELTRVLGIDVVKATGKAGTYSLGLNQASYLDEVVKRFEDETGPSWRLKRLKPPFWTK